MTKSKIFLYFCLSFIIGIGLSSFLIIPVSIVGIILIIGVSLIIVWWNYNSKLVIVGCCLVFVVLGIYRYTASIKNDFFQNNIASYNNYSKSLSIEGLINKESDERSDTVKYEVASQKINFNNEWENINGNFLVTMAKYPSYHYGDLVEFKGNLKSPGEFDNFSYKNYLARYDIYSIMDYPQTRLLGNHQGSEVYAWILSIKHLFQENINKVVPEPHSSFLSGLLLGAKKQIPQSLLADFNKTGTTHIVAVSGYNITIIAFLMTSFLLLIGASRYWAFWFSIIGVLFFTVITGASASVARASIMGILILVAGRLGRLSRATNGLIFSGIVMLLGNPKLLRFDVGFQLSFLATIGLIFFSDIIKNWLGMLVTRLNFFSAGLNDPEYKFAIIKDTLSATLAAQIFALPIIAYNFGQISLISPLANILILPAIPITMLVGFIGGIMGFIWLLPAKLIGYLAWVLLSYEIKVVEILGLIPLSSITVKKFSWVWVLGYYVIAAILYYRLKSRNKKQLIPSSI